MVAGPGIRGPRVGAGWCVVKPEAGHGGPRGGGRQGAPGGEFKARGAHWRPPSIVRGGPRHGEEGAEVGQGVSRKPGPIPPGPPP